MSCSWCLLSRVSCPLYMCACASCLRRACARAMCGAFPPYLHRPCMNATLACVPCINATLASASLGTASASLGTASALTPPRPLHHFCTPSASMPPWPVHPASMPPWPLHHFGTASASMPPWAMHHFGSKKASTRTAPTDERRGFVVLKALLPHQACSCAAPAHPLAALLPSDPAKCAEARLTLRLPWPRQV